MALLTLEGVYEGGRIELKAQPAFSSISEPAPSDRSMVASDSANAATFGQRASAAPASVRTSRNRKRD